METTVVRPYRGTAEDREAFRALNLAWIEKHFDVEERDLRDLGDPDAHIIAHGGAIFMAEIIGGENDRIVGTVALIVHGDCFELAKMAVEEHARGFGFGRLLGEAVIAEARKRGAKELELVSNTELAPAIALYRALGFQEVEIGETEYSRVDIKMVLKVT
ncbi:MAG TPA: GNAT family N-acetyltransferase [Longimicrobiales bacterium]|nr:GNAT family N-acetyltransferase [Longimicrobiales bacterium]